MKFRHCLSLLLLFSLPVSAQRRTTPLNDIIPQGEYEILKNQEKTLFKTLDQLVAPKFASVVAIRDGKNRWRALGTVVTRDKVLTKLSELGKGSVFVQDSDGKLVVGEVIKTDEENDLALIRAMGIKSVPVDFNRAAEVGLGDFMVASGMNGKAAAFGVTSVPQRNLREQDMALLGIVTSESKIRPGLIVDQVPNGPARAAGLRGGDRLTKVEDVDITGLFKLRKTLLEYQPGDTIRIQVERAGKTKAFQVTLGKRPDMGFSSARLNQMNRMGGNRLSRQRDNYPLAIQTDMVIQPEQAGAPVYNLDGKLVGMTIARAGRIESYILPVSVIQEFIKK